MAKVRPLHDRLLVKRIEEKETVIGRDHHPRHRDRRSPRRAEGHRRWATAKILDNGTKVPLDVKAGDKILFGKYSGTDIKIGQRGVPHPSRGRSPRGHRQIGGRGRQWRSRSHTETTRARRCSAA